MSNTGSFQSLDRNKLVKLQFVCEDKLEFILFTFTFLNDLEILTCAT
jgi:hypothetical protein